MRGVFVSSSSGLCTPRVSGPSDQSMALSANTRPSVVPDQLSPLPAVPITRTSSSRTSSRNLKENILRPSGRRLASPFSSRPGSRATSPDKLPRGHKMRPGHHAKSRTLSQSGALREKVVGRNIIQATPSVLDVHSIPVLGVTEVEMSVPMKVTAPTHNRSSSTPMVKPALDDLTSGSWLVPPRQVPRSSSPPGSPGVDGNKQQLAVDHPSFFVDEPMQISTPPRRRRSATVGIWAHGLMPQLDADPPPPVRSFRYDSDVDMSDSSLPGSPVESKISRAHPPRRRRRTIVHLSSDSLFSSALDFSGMMSETERSPRAPASEGSRSPAEVPPINQVDLEPAFSISQHAPNSSHKIRPRTTATNSTYQSSGSTAPSSGIRPDSPGSFLLSSNPSPSPVQASPCPDGDELLDLFSVLGLDGKSRLSNRSVETRIHLFPDAPRYY